MDVAKVRKKILKRHICVLMGCLGFMNVYALRVNLSVAIVSMVKSSPSHPFDNSSIECPYPLTDISTNTSDSSTGKFDWDGKTRGLILSAFFYGYIITQIPGSILARKFGSKLVFGLGTLCTGIFTLLTPLAAELGPYVLFSLRFAEGFGEGVTFPAMYNMLAHWIPPLERSKLAVIVFAGTHLGTVISQSLSGVICDEIGWQWVFYIFGILSILWFIFWMYLIADSPDKHSTITPEERSFIEESIGERLVVQSVPWLSVMKSLPFWSIFIARCCDNWGFYTLLTCLPQYLSDVLHLDIKTDGFISSLPYLFQGIFQIVGGQIADYLRSREILSTTSTRKVFNTVGLMVPAICLFIISYLGCNKWMIVGMMVSACGGCGFAGSGHQINIIDIAPAYAGVLLGVTNTFATIPGIVSPQIVGILTKSQSTIGQWRKVFCIASGIYSFGALFYLIFSSGKKQQWAELKKDQIDGELDNYAFNAIDDKT